MARSKADWKETIRNLYKKANAEGVTAAEKEIIEEQVALLAAKHGVEVVMDKTHNDVIVHETYNFAAPFAKQKASLYNGMAKRFNCTVVVSKGVYHLHGFKADYDRLEFLFKLVITQAFIDLANVEVPYWENQRSFKISWWYGFVNAVCTRLDEANKMATAEAPSGYGIELYDRTKRVEAIRDQLFPVLRKGSKRVANSSSGWNAGRESGQRANLDDREEITEGQRALSAPRR